jgi:hypothetical protein
MSLLYEAVPHADHDWLTVGKRAVIITSGPHTDKVICITISQKTADLDGDGVPEQLNVKIRSTMVVLESGEPVLVGETVIGTTANVHSMYLDPPADGDIDNEAIDIINWIAELIDNSVHKCLRHESALKAFSLIPIESI